MKFLICLSLLAMSANVAAKSWVVDKHYKKMHDCAEIANYAYEVAVLRYISFGGLMLANNKTKTEKAIFNKVVALPSLTSNYEIQQELDRFSAEVLHECMVDVMSDIAEGRKSD